MVQHPLLRTVVEATLGRGAIIASLAGIHKMPGKGAVPLHVDYTMIPSPFPEYGLTGVAVWALEDWTIDAGPTWIMPGSHRRRRSPTPSDIQEGGVPIIMPKGSVTFFGDGVWHWQGDRTAPGARVTLHAQYVRGFLRPLDRLNVDQHMLERNGPAFYELTGQDDPFEKSGAYGHDMERWAHMTKLLRLQNE
jgi:ectoine hydroxylase-related dioxygenase (phytanoyl-CoA dioxygenase family)